MSDFVAIECFRCKEVFGLDKATHAQLRRSQGSFHCPWGHSQYFPAGESETDKLRRERDRLKQQETRLIEEAQIAWNTVKLEQRRGAAARGQITKLKKRAAGGVCPCCNRQFAALGAHMAAKHPGFVAAPLDQDQVA